jgi:hypothetical protein
VVASFFTHCDLLIFAMPTRWRLGYEGLKNEHGSVTIGNKCHFLVIAVPFFLCRIKTLLK